MFSECSLNSVLFCFVLFCSGDTDGDNVGGGDGYGNGDGDGDGDGPYTMVITLELLCVKAERKVGGREKWHRA